MKQTVIAIDGPSGSGKSAVSQGLAKSLGIDHIDTGATYRALAYRAHQEAVPFKEGPRLQEFLNTVDLHYNLSHYSLSINGEDVTREIRSQQVSHLASLFSTLRSVREYLLLIQRKLPNGQPCVMEGRDIGTVVFPNSFCKFFITASLQIRAERRSHQINKNNHDNTNIESIVEELIERDQRDSTRKVTPLTKAHDAELVDTSNLNLKETVAYLSLKAKERAHAIGLSLSTILINRMDSIGEALLTLY